MASNVTLCLPQGDDLDLLLVGKSGNGKTSAGNAILGRKTLTSLGKAKAHQVGYSVVDGRVIKVVEVLGFCHQPGSTPDEDSAKIFTYALKKGISQFPNGFNAIVFVMSLNDKFGQGDEEVIQVLKEILGVDVMNKCGVCLLTHGDVVDFDEKTAKLDDVKINDEDGNGNNDKAFLKWCKGQSGGLSELFTDCDYRCVVFDNVSEDEACQKRQRLELVKCVDKLKNKHSIYTLDTKVTKTLDPELMERKRKLSKILEMISREIEFIKEAIVKLKEERRQQNPTSEIVRDNTGCCSNSNSFLNTIKMIKNKSDRLLDEIGHHEPEKLAALKPDLEQIRKIVGEFQIDNKCEEGSKNGAVGDCDMKDGHAHGHDKDRDPSRRADELQQVLENEHVPKAIKHNDDQKLGHAARNDGGSNSSQIMCETETSLSSDDDDEDKLDLILETTEKVKVKLEEIKGKEEEVRHSWTSPVSRLFDSAFPSFFEGIVDAADFFVDTLINM